MVTVGQSKAVTGVDNVIRLRKLVVVVVAVLLAYVVLHDSAGAAFLCGALAASVCGLVDSRLSIAIGLFCLASYPILAAAESVAWLQQSSLVNYYATNIGIYSMKNVIDTMMAWAFYFLVIGLLGQLVRYLVHREKSFDNA